MLGERVKQSFITSPDHVKFSFFLRRKKKKKNRSRRCCLCLCLVLFSKLCVTSWINPYIKSLCAVRQFCNSIKCEGLSNRWSVLESHVLSRSLIFRRLLVMHELIRLLSQTQFYKKYYFLSSSGPMGNVAKWPVQAPDHSILGLGTTNRRLVE